MGNLKGSLMHARREQYTPNADPSQKENNILLTDTPTVQSVLELYQQKKPEKIRNDQVRAIEVLVTASPEAMAAMTEEQRVNYLKEALKFANQEMGGEENLLHAEIHNDETTAHLTAFYIPLVTTRNVRSGKAKTGLNAKVLMGDKMKFSERQTKFHQEVACKYGLERGEIGSKAQHTTIRDFYRQANQIQSVNDVDLKKLKQEVKNTIKIERNGFLGTKTEEFKVNPYLDVETLVNALRPIFSASERSKFFGIEQRKRDEERRKKQIKDEIEQKNRELELKYREKMAQLGVQSQELKAKQVELERKESNLREVLKTQIAEQERAKWKWVTDYFVSIWQKFFKNDYDDNSQLTYTKVQKAINDTLTEHYNTKNEIKALKEMLGSTKAELEALKEESMKLKEKLNDPRYVKELHERYEHQAQERLKAQQQRSLGMRMGR